MSNRNFEFRLYVFSRFHPKAGRLQTKVPVVCVAAIFRSHGLSSLWVGRRPVRTAMIGAPPQLRILTTLSIGLAASPLGRPLASREPSQARRPGQESTSPHPARAHKPGDRRAVGCDGGRNQSSASPGGLPACRTIRETTYRRFMQPRQMGRGSVGRASRHAPSPVHPPKAGFEISTSAAALRPA